MWLIKRWVQTVRDWQQQWAAEGGRWIGKMDSCDEVKKCEGMMWMLCVFCVLCVLLSSCLCWFPGFTCFPKWDSLSPTLSASLLFLFSAFLSSLSSPVLSHQGLSSSGLICRSSSANLIGDRLSLAWHGDELPNPFSPSCLRLAPLDVQRCTLMLQLQQLQRQAQRSNAPSAHCLNAFKSCNNC